MVKVKLKDATKELLGSAENVLVSISRVRKGADELMQIVRKMEAHFTREEEQRYAEERQAEQERLVMQHTRAYTMPDADEMDLASDISADDSLLPTQQEQAVHVTYTEPVEGLTEQEPEIPSKQAKKDAVKTSSRKKKTEEANALPDESEPATAKAQRDVTAEPSAETAQNAVPVMESAKPVSPVQPVMRQVYPVRPVAPNTAARPSNTQSPYGRPANAMGPYGRPANPQASYGNMAPAQGPYGRPASPQGPYGRPANPQGPYGRPVSPQGTYGRPAAPAMPVKGGVRPARPAAGFGRPAGGMVRPAGVKPKPTEMTPALEKERVSNYDPNKKNYVRQHDPERVAKNRKQLARESFAGSLDDDVVRGGRRARSRKPSAQQLMAPIRIEKAFMTAETITVKDLTERIGKPAGEILKKLLLLGMMANINSELDYDTASLVCSEFGVELEVNMARTAEDELTDTDFEDAEEDLEDRPPVITIMGHVDHGKTSLLDYIRKAKVTASEAGGITQHIGAYTVDLDDRWITFLDTPGHEAFTAMRARGAQSTDIAILVVAADDGVMPQTVEAINHAKAADVPIIVAINKMDKETANPERVKQDLTAYELVPEEWGGDTIMVPVSAYTGDGVDTLLEMILLTSDMLQLRANPNRMAKGVIIEAKLDKTRGPVATVLLQNGTLRVGDNVVAGMASGRVRAMMNDRGERVPEAGPSMPVEISGFTEVPSAGDDMMVVADDHLGRQVVQERRDKVKAARVASSKVSLDNLFSHIDQGKLLNLNIIIKADVQGSVEAVKQALVQLSNDEIRVRVLHSGVGAITKDDVNLASAFGAIIIGFNIRPDSNARETADREEVDIRLYRVIYHAIEDIQKAMKGLLAPEFKELLLGHAEVRNIFRITGAGTVAGCYVQDGKLQRNAEVRLLRDNVVVFEGKLSSLKRFKDDAREVAAGYECGVSFDAFNDIKENDVVECFQMEEVER